jgi:hypothetical protein
MRLHALAIVTCIAALLLGCGTLLLTPVVGT